MCNLTEKYPSLLQQPSRAMQSAQQAGRCDDRIELSYDEHADELGF